MFRRKKKDQSELDEAIAQTYSRMDREGPGSEQYPKLLKDLKKLLALKNGERRFRRPSTDTLVIAAAAVAQVVFIAIYESHGHVWTSKATGFITKPKT